MNKINTINILFCGTGGQGVLKASEICGITAMKAGYNVKKSEIHGMAQRGGSVESHLRFGQKVYSPLITPHSADFLVCFHTGEALRMHDYLKNDGLDFSHFLGEINKLKHPIYINTYFLGILASQLQIEKDLWIDTLLSILTKDQDGNRKVFEEGYLFGENLKAEHNN
jgi:indolepyruvate ferredoxin oxidoreductase, beta subunit